MIDSIINEHFGGYSVVRADYLQITGDACAAQILHSLEYWTAYRLLEIERVEQQNNEAIKSGSQVIPVPSVWLYEKIQDFIDAICGTFKRNKVIEALKLLKSKGFIESKPSPVPRDQTLLYKFNVDEVEDALREAKASKGFSSRRKPKSQSLDSNDESLDLNPTESLDLNRKSPDLNSVQCSDLNSDPLYNSRSNIQDQNSEDPPTPQGGTDISQNVAIDVEVLKPEPEQPHAHPEDQQLKTDALTTQKISPKDRSSASALFYGLTTEQYDRIKDTYNQHKPKAWRSLNSVYKALKDELRGIIGGDDFRGDLEAFLQRLENALAELNHPASSFSWWSKQTDKGLITLIRDGRLFQFSDAWTEREQQAANPSDSDEEIPQWLQEAYAEFQAKKAG